MDTYTIGKRIIDIVGALFGIILLSPLMLSAAILIKIVSPKGPILADIPVRVSKNGGEFKMFKFRSMIPNAHNWLQQNPEWLKKYQDNNYKLNEDEDPRFLPGARLMRKYSIDEFPQFFNVLKGDMSLVGPRAYYPFELVEQAKRFPETVEDIKILKTAKPGITGVWQVNGRSKIPFVQRVKMDAEYAKRKSLVYDLLIILKTPWAVFTSKGAY